MTHARFNLRHFTVLLLALFLVLASLTLVVGTAFAAGMDGMDMGGSTPSATPTPVTTPLDSAATTTDASAHNSDGMTDAEMAAMNSDKGSVNWPVIGGFIALIGASTIAAVAIKANLRRKALAGGLKDAGTQDV